MPSCVHRCFKTHDAFCQTHRLLKLRKSAPPFADPTRPEKMFLGMTRNLHAQAYP